ncbi:MAG: hypothetical protein O3C60_01690 [Planctomycetota bacterium]|nr:hypothetical protein [Planctomycetota bacterium]
MVRTDPNDPSTAVLRANSLVDLTLRENRYAHLGQFGEGPNSFPFPLRLERLRYTNQLAKLLVDPILLANLLVDPSQRVDLLVDPNRLSEYLSLADTLAFDVKAFDPTAPLQLAGGTLAVAPSDPGYDNDPQKRRQQWRGAYVDLSYANDQPNVVDDQSPPLPPFRSEFSTVPARRSGWLKINNKWDTSSIRGFYDTWPRSYERDGHAQQNGSYAPPGPNVVADRGTNGLDDDNQNGVDDSGEFETAPPYSADLRGIEVSVRVFEFNTRQVRQASIVADFTEGLGP